MFNLLHRLRGKHVPDPEHNHWQHGHFVSVCDRCGRAMVKLPGLPWQVGSG